MIQLRGVTKYYGQRMAVQDIDIDINKGQIAGLLGPNGAGKTTILRILTCYMPATKGKVMVDGLDADKDSLRIRQRLGFMPENVPLYGDLSLEQFFRFACRAKGIPARAAKAEMAKVISLCGLEGHEGRLIKHLSKGLRQRVGIAQALIGDPQILILDEPTSGLDPAQVVEIRELIRELGKTRTIILSTHILAEASQVCDMVIILNRGRVVAQGTLAELGRKLQHEGGSPVLVRTDATEDAMSKLKALPFVYEISRNDTGIYEVTLDTRDESKANLIREMVNLGLNVFEVKQRELSLEEIFIKLVLSE